MKMTQDEIDDLMGRLLKIYRSMPGNGNRSSDEHIAFLSGARMGINAILAACNKPELNEAKQ